MYTNRIYIITLYARVAAVFECAVRSGRKAAAAWNNIVTTGVGGFRSAAGHRRQERARFEFPRICRVRRGGKKPAVSSAAMAAEDAYYTTWVRIINAN